MDGFKKNPKIACFKEGGQVGYKSRKDHSESKEMAQDIKQDKAIVKKAVGQHESAKHKGEGKTELKLKCGGRAKKETGTVKKYKKGGEVIGMKKTAEDKKDIAGIKKKGSAPKKIAPKTKKMPIQEMDMAAPEFPMEGELPAFQVGGGVPVGQGAMSEIDRKMMESERQRKMARTKNARGAGLNPGQMAQFAGQEMAGQGAISDMERSMAQPAQKAPIQRLPMPPTGGAAQSGQPGVMGAMKGMLQGGINMGQPGQPGGMAQTEQPGGMGPSSDSESIMEGLRQLGKFARGGCV